MLNLMLILKKLRPKQVYIFFSSILIFVLHIPISFAKSFSTDLAGGLGPSGPVSVKEPLPGPSSPGLYDSLRLNILGLSRKAYELALEGMENLLACGRIENGDLISIVDFSRPSDQKRLFVIDLQKRKLLFNTYVAHGQGSGTLYAKCFSNKPSSFQSSLGFYETSDTYYGKHGYSMKLEGLEKGINHLAEQRAIVMHAAPYVNENYIRSKGFPGRSQGCPALPEKINKPIIEKIKNGTCLFIFGPDHQYLRLSPVLNR